jgi:molybdate transport system substrate-binding protein
MTRSVIRRGGINPLVIVLLGGLVAAGLLLLLLPGPRTTTTRTEPGLQTGSPGDATPLVMLVAAGLRAPVEQILEKYRQEYGVPVEVQYGGSNMLLNQLKINKFEQPDLYLAADSFYIDQAVSEGLAAEVMPLATQVPVVAFRADRDPQAESWADLMKAEPRWSLADPEQAAVGRVVREVLTTIPGSQPDEHLWAELEAQTTRRGVFKPTVNEVANDIKIGAVDLGIVWSSTVASPEYRGELVGLPLERLTETASVGDIAEQIGIAVLTTSSRPTEALRLARYFAASDRGLAVFESFGMTPAEGDVWSLQPEITFFCGAVNRRAIEPVIEAFQQREGVVINTVFDGCGILTSRMGTIAGQSQKSGFPDVYMACDRYYLDNVREWFQEDVDVSQTEIVLVVPKGSEQVRKVEDLLLPGVRVSVGEPNQCTIGALTRRLLQQAGLYDRLKEKQGQAGEVVVEKSSSALIVPDIVTGHVDVAIAYRNDVLTHSDKVDMIPIDSPLTKAIQPLSIARNSEHKQLVRRLYRQVERAQENFEKVGFDFLLSDPAAPF